MGFGTSDNGQLDDDSVAGAIILPVGQGELLRVNRSALTLTFVHPVPTGSTTPVEATWAWEYETAAQSQVWAAVGSHDGTFSLMPQWTNADGCALPGCP